MSSRTVIANTSVQPTDVRRQLNAVGGIIILLVLCASYTLGYQSVIGHRVDLSGFPPVGFLALQLFLASTAFRLAEELHVSGGYAFLRGRVLRFGPLVVPAVLLSYCLLRFANLPGMPADGDALTANLLMVEDLVGAPRIDEGHWRLKIELMLAVELGLVWFGLGRKHLRAVLTVGLIASACLLCGEPERQSTLTLAGLGTLDGYLPVAALGVVLLHLRKDRRDWGWWTLGAAAAVLAFLSNTPLHGAVVLASFGVFALVVSGRVGWLGRLGWLVRLGELAFPIYVTHRVLGFVVIHQLEGLGAHPGLAIGVAGVVAVFVGWVACQLLERPAGMLMGRAEGVVRSMRAGRSALRDRADLAGDGLGAVGERRRFV